MHENMDDYSQNDLKLLKHFSIKELQFELNRKQTEQRNLEIKNIVGSREPIGFFDVFSADENTREWELHIIFSDATKHCFTFSSKVGQSSKSMDEFRMLYFPHLTRSDFAEWKGMVQTKKQSKKKKKQVCLTA